MTGGLFLEIHQGLPRESPGGPTMERAGFSDRVKALNCSMSNMAFADSSFDVVWSEGSIYIVGFERGLREWMRLIKPGGHLVVHDVTWLRPGPPAEIVEYWSRNYSGIRCVKESTDIIARCGYKLVGHFTLPEDAWWVEYYGPLEDRLRRLRVKYAGDNAANLASPGTQGGG